MEVLPADNRVKLKKTVRIGKSEIGVGIEFPGTSLDWRKSPIQRRTLYFNQLKDFDKYVVLDYKKRGEPGINTSYPRDIP